MSFSCELSASSPSTHGALSAAPDFSCCSSPDSASVDPVDVLVDVLDSGLGLTEETRLPVEVDGEAVDCAVVRPEARRSEIIQNQLDIKWPTRYFVSSHHREIKTPPEETTSDDGSLGMRITKKSFHVSRLILFLLRMFYFFTLLHTWIFLTWFHDWKTFLFPWFLCCHWVSHMTGKSRISFHQCHISLF